MPDPAATFGIGGYGPNTVVCAPTAGLLLATVFILAFLWAERQQRRKAAPPQALQHQQALQQQQQRSSGDTAAPTCGCGVRTMALRARSVSCEPRAPNAIAASPFALARSPAFGSLDAAAAAQQRQQERQQEQSKGAQTGAGSTSLRLGHRRSPPHLSTMLQLPPLLQQGQDEQGQAFASRRHLEQQPWQKEGQGLTAADSLSAPSSPARCSHAAAASLPGTAASGTTGSPAAAAPAASSGRAGSPGGTAGTAGRSSADRASLGELLSELSLSAQPMEQLLSGLALQPAPPVPLQPAPRQRSPLRGSLEGPPLLDWEVSPKELEICRRPDGKLWQLGAGGYGRVYRAIRFGVQPVAVKVLAPTSESRPGELEEICREAELLKACKDPNIVAFLGASLSAEFTLLVLELCEGGALSANLAAGRVNWYKRGKQVAVDVARGLAYLHGRRLIHLDLKSGNILLDRHGHAKVSDLGLARIAAHESAVTAAVGTLDWAAPEVLLGQRCTEKADIYSFGVCLWEIATQERPIRGRMRPLECPRDCPQDVAALVAACMDPKPSMRPSAQQLVERLLAAPADAPLGAGEGREAPAQPPRSVSMAVLRSPGPGGPASPQPDPQALRSSAPAARPLGWMQQAAPGHDAIEGPSAGAEAPGPAMSQAGPTLPAGSAKGMPRAASSPTDMARPCDMTWWRTCTASACSEINLLGPFLP